MIKTDTNVAYYPKSNVGWRQGIERNELTSLDITGQRVFHGLSQDFYDGPHKWYSPMSDPVRTHENEYIWIFEEAYRNIYRKYLY